MKALIVSLLCASLWLPGIVVAENPPAYGDTKVEKIVRSYYRKNGLVGLSVSIKRAGTKNYVFGMENLESRTRMTSKSVFRIASVSKLFSMLGIMLLKEQGRLAVDDPISRYIPGFPYGDQISIKNLLQHTSGIPNFAALDAFSENTAKEWQPDELVKLLESHLQGHPLDFEPGTKAAYSNSNFMLLAVIIQAVSAMPYKDFVATKIVAPLGMKHTGVGSDSAIIRHRAAGYYNHDGTITNAQFNSVVAPFGTGDMMSQPKELAKISAVFTPGTLLTADTIDEMVQPAVLKDGSTVLVDVHGNLEATFGYCWEMYRVKGKSDWIYTKSGQIDGFNAYVFFFPKAGTSVALSANTWFNGDLFNLGLQIGEALGAMK